MKVPFVELQTQYHDIGRDIDRAIKGVLESGVFVVGDRLKSFEVEFAAYCGLPYGIGVASGTDALELSLRALGIGKGDEVITTPFTFIATTNSVIACGARPVFADIEICSYNIDPGEIEKILKKDRQGRVKAVIPVHMYGRPCDMQAISGLAQKYSVKIIEDCAQSVGAEYGGRRTGTFGMCGCFSFFPSKNLGAYGDGGMVVTADQRICGRIKMMRYHGVRDKYYHVIEGVNSRLDELQAAVLSVKLRYIDDWNEARRRRARLYSKHFCDAGLDGEIALPEERKGCKHVYHIYAVRVKGRDKLMSFLKDKRVATGIHYPVPLHLEKVYRRLGYRRGDFPAAEKAAREVVSLPMYPELAEAQIGYVVNEVKRFFRL